MDSLNNFQTSGTGPDPDIKTLYNILKYSFILQYLLKYESLFINEYKIKLFKELLKISNNFSYLLILNNKELNKELNKIINEYFILTAVYK